MKGTEPGVMLSAAIFAVGAIVALLILLGVVKP